MVDHSKPVGAAMVVGGGIAGVQAALGEDTLHQLDIGHLFGEVAHVDAEVERSAYKHLREEEERWRVLDSARSDRVITSRIDAWEKAPHKTEEAILLYDDFHSLAEELYGLFSPLGSQPVLPAPERPYKESWKRSVLCWS